MPFTYSIAYGVIGGIFAYIIINGVVLIIDRASGGRIHPDYSQRENWWSAVFSRSFLPLWIRYLVAKARGQEFDWHQDEFDLDEDDTNSQQAPHYDDECHSPTVVVNGSIRESPSPHGLETLNSIHNEKH
jgi:AGZA family xanthine/uracil permease-like MFS transporter